MFVCHEEYEYPVQQNLLLFDIHCLPTKYLCIKTHLSSEHYCKPRSASLFTHSFSVSLSVTTPDSNLLATCPCKLIYCVLLKCRLSQIPSQYMLLIFGLWCCPSFQFFLLVLHILFLSQAYLSYWKPTYYIMLWPLLSICQMTLIIWETQD